MADGKKSRAKSQFQIKLGQLRKLKKSGLYSGDINPNKALTPRQQRVLKDYRDVLAGHAKVVTVPHRGEYRSQRAATKRAGEIADQYSTVVRRYKDKLIVRVSRPDEKVTVNPREGTFTTVRRTKSGEKEYTHFLQPGDKLPELQRGETYGLPFSRGTDGIEWQFRADPDEIMALANEYETRKNYRGAMGYVAIVTSTDYRKVTGRDAYREKTPAQKNPKKSKKSPAKKSAPKKPPRKKPPPRREGNVIHVPFPRRGRRK